MTPEPVPPPESLTRWWCAACGRDMPERHAWHIKHGQLAGRCAGDLEEIHYRRALPDGR